MYVYANVLHGRDYVQKCRTRNSLGPPRGVLAQCPRGPRCWYIVLLHRGSESQSFQAIRESCQPLGMAWEHVRTVPHAGLHADTPSSSFGGRSKMSQKKQLGMDNLLGTFTEENMEFAYEHWDLLGFTETGYAFLVIKDGTTNPSFQVFIFLWMAGLVRNHIPGRRRGYPAMTKEGYVPGTNPCPALERVTV